MIEEFKTGHLCTLWVIIVCNDGSFYDYAVNILIQAGVEANSDLNPNRAVSKFIILI